MEKPSDFDSTQSLQSFTNFEKLEKGGHICRILKAEKCLSKTGRVMLKLFLDTDKTDKQPEFFKRKYDSDKRENKKWGCIFYQSVQKFNASKTNEHFKALIENIEQSNNWRVVWGDRFFENLQDKLIGCVFRGEEYIGSDGMTHKITKCFASTTVEEIKRGVPIPKDKLLSSNELTNFDELPF